MTVTGRLLAPDEAQGERRRGLAVGEAVTVVSPIMTAGSALGFSIVPVPWLTRRVALLSGTRERSTAKVFARSYRGAGSTMTVIGSSIWPAGMIERGGGNGRVVDAGLGRAIGRGVGQRRARSLGAERLTMKITEVGAFGKAVTVGLEIETTGGGVGVEDRAGAGGPPGFEEGADRIRKVESEGLRGVAKSLSASIGTETVSMVWPGANISVAEAAV